MNCANHQQTPAVAYCRTCGKPLCESCKREVHGLIFCEDCIASRVQGVPVAPGVVNPQAPNPSVAFVLGLIPGVGAMYCGEFMRALIHVGVFVGLIVATSEIHGLFGIGIAFWCLYMVFDSYQIAKAKQEGRPVPELFGFTTSSAPSAAATGTPAPAVPVAPMVDVNRSQNMPIGPLILIALGVIFLLHTMDWFPFHHIGRLWPLVLVGIGGWLIWQRTQRAVCRCVSCTAISFMGPVILITIGTMGLLDEFTRIGWGESWPLILIVIGVLKFLQVTGSRVGHLGPGAAPAPAAPPEQNEVSRG